MHRKTTSIDNRSTATMTDDDEMPITDQLLNTEAAAPTSATAMNKSDKLFHSPIPLILLLGISSIILLQQPNQLLFSTAFSPPPPLVVPLPLPPLLLTSTTTAPVLGILGSLLFKPRSIKIVKSSNYPSGTRFNKDDDEDVLTKAGIFFVDAFWAGKIGGATTLSTTQANTLERQQIQEFKKRYGSSLSSSSFSRSSSSSSSSNSSSGSGSVNRLPGRYADKLMPAFDARAELVLCVNSKGECLGCAGVEGECLI